MARKINKAKPRASPASSLEITSQTSLSSQVVGLADPNTDQQPQTSSAVTSQDSIPPSSHFACEVCSRAFTTKTGLGVHRHKAHPDFANELNRPKLVKGRWHQEETSLLAKREAELLHEGTENINQALEGFLPGRSFDAIKSHRKSANYRALVQEYLSYLGTVPEESSSDSDSDSPICSDSHIATSTPYKIWKKAESRALALREIELTVSGVRFINLELAKFMKHRSIESIRNHRRRPEYKKILDGLRNHNDDLSLSSDDATLSPPPQHVDCSSYPDSPPCEIHPQIVARDGPPQESSPFITKLLELESSNIDMFRNCDLTNIIRLASTGHSFSAELENFIHISLPNPGKSQRKRQKRPPPPNGRRGRKHRFAFFQNLYRKNRKKCAHLVLDGESTPTSFTVNDFFNIWEPVYTGNNAVLPPSDPTDRAPTLASIWEPITIGELCKTKIPLTSAPGPDGVTPKQIKDIPYPVMGAILNLIMLQGFLPPSLNKSKTIFLPKCDNPETPSDFRPISITPILTRHFHRILANRLKSNIQWDSRQRAFLDNDGCAENTSIMLTVLQDSHINLKPLYIGTLDVKKAFDSASHSAVQQAFELKGCPDGFLQYYAAFQQSGTTYFSCYDGDSAEFMITQGVRQGDPISPYAFNAIMDQMLDNLPKDIGYDLDGTTINAPAFADDLNLLASTKIGLQTLLDSATSFLEKRNLLMNVSKCHTVSITPCGKQKKIYIDKTPSFTINDKLVPAKSVEESWKYLGVRFCTNGHTKCDVNDVPNLLNKITAAPLKPQQRLFILKTFLMPRLYHRLTLSELTVATLNKLDKQIRTALRSWLKLPKDTPKAYFHASTKDGGLGVHSIRWMVPRLQFQRLRKLQESNVPSIHAAGNNEITVKRLRKAEKLCTFEGASNTTKAAQTSMWASILHGSVDGKGLREAGAVPRAHRWISDGTGLMSGRDFVLATKLRINALPTRARTSRGRDFDSRCRAGCDAKETLPHVLNHCQKTHSSRIKRHDGIVKFVAEKLSNANTLIHIEPHYRTAEGLRKPDLVIKKDNIVHVLDAQVVSDSLDLENEHLRKSRYYSENKNLTSLIANEHKCGVSFSSITTNLRGCIAPSSEKSLLQLGLRKNDVKIISLRALQGGISSWFAFNRDTRRSR